MILVILAVLLCILSVLFLIELSKENRVATAELVLSRAWYHRFAKQDLEDKKAQFLKLYEKYHTCSRKKAAKKVKEWDKQIGDYQKSEDAYMSGQRFSMVDGIALFGYQLLTDLKVNAGSDTFKKLADSCEHAGYLELERGQETGGRRNSYIYAYYLIASLVSYAYVGVLLALFLAIVMTAMGREMSNVLIFAVAGLGIMLLLGYLPYDGLQARARKRKEAIDRDFSNVISKMTLLATAGMGVVRAIEETAQSGEGILYLELQKVVDGIHKSMSVGAAFTELQCRCSNKYLDKMITIITKSFIDGNTNLAENLRAVNSECWLDKKHNSRRMGEVIQSKLFIPTMLMFVGVLVVIVVPAMSGFSF